jgi:hypothetical protein
VQAHPIAHAKRARAQQHCAGDEIADRLLGSEADDDRRDRAADRQRLRVETGEAQSHEHGQQEGHQPNQEAHCPGGTRIEPLQELGADGAA